MSTIKVVLRSKVNKDGTFPLAIRITKDRKTSFIHLGYNLKKEEWIEAEQKVKPSHPNSKRLNNYILKRKAEANDVSLELETNKKSATVRAIKTKIKPLAGASFVPQSNQYLENFQKTGNYNCYIAEKSRVKIFVHFISGKDISKGKPTGKKDVKQTGLSDIAFSDITVGLLSRFRVELQSKRQSSDRTIANYMITIRSIFNQAIKDGVVEEKYYPFGKGKTSIEFPESTKVGISEEDLRKLETVKLDVPVQDHARNLWLTSYYFAGMRISDVLRLRWSDFKELRLHYVMGKNNKAGSVKASAQVIEILNKYLEGKRSPDDLIFPDLKILADSGNQFEEKRIIAQTVNRCNKTLSKFVAPLAGIESKLTMHISRHTFATFAGDKIPVQMLQQLYRHSDIKTTLGYQANFIYKDADDALEAVIGK